MMQRCPQRLRLFFFFFAPALAPRTPLENSGTAGSEAADFGAALTAPYLLPSPFYMPKINDAHGRSPGYFVHFTKLFKILRSYLMPSALTYLFYNSAKLLRMTAKFKRVIGTRIYLVKHVR
jgi:hypothetical protein